MVLCFLDPSLSSMRVAVCVGGAQLVHNGLGEAADGRRERFPFWMFLTEGGSSSRDRRWCSHYVWVWEQAWMGDGSCVCLWLSQMWCWELPDGDVGVLGSQLSGRLESWLLALAAGPARTGLGLLAGGGARRSSGLLGNCCWGLRFSWGLDFVACHGPGCGPAKNCPV